MSKDEKDMMGFDPLEWLKEEGTGASLETSAEQSDDTNHKTQSAEPVVAEEPVDSIPEEPAAREQNDESSSIASVAEKTVEIDLGSSLQIMDVAVLKQQLQEILNGQSELTLRADPDISIDGAGMQLLLAFVQQACRSGVTLQWKEIPIPIVEAAKLLNTEQLLLE